MRGHFVRFGDEALNDFEAVSVGVVLLHAAEGVADWCAKKTHYIEQQQQNTQRGPIGFPANAPRDAPSFDQPMQKTVRQK